MDRKIANNVIVGVVVTVGFIGFLFLLFNTGTGEGIFQRHYDLFVRYNDVKGLHYGSEVALSGLHVGVVKKISIAKDNPKQLRVDLSIDKEYEDRIRVDSYAVIRTQGVLGDRYVDITLGSPDEPILKPGSELPARQDEDLFAKGGDLVEEMKQQFKKGSDLEELLHHLNVLSANLATLSTDIRREKGTLHELIYGNAGVKLSAATENLKEVLQKINNGEGTLGALVNDPSVYEDIRELLGGAKRSNILKYFMRSFIRSGQEEEPTSRK